MYNSLLNDKSTAKLPQLIQEVEMEQEARDTILNFISELLKFVFPLFFYLFFIFSLSIK